MLFSSPEVAKFINDNFEPAWESVRAAPIVTIDFGNGHVVKRTLQGNIATYVCGPDGVVYDVLPGIYTPDVYRKQLETLAAFAKSLTPKTGMPAPRTDAEKKLAADVLASRLRLYHGQQAQRLAAMQAPPPPVRQFGQLGGGFKGGGGFQPQPGGGFGGGFQPQPLQFGGGGGFQINGGQFSGGNFGTPAARPPSGIEGPLIDLIAGQPPAAPGAVPKGPLAGRPELKTDTEANERIRRKAVHDELSRRGLVRPDDIKKWLYKEVLHADLDDPKLGLGPMLDANYPFADEDKAARPKE